MIRLCRAEGLLKMFLITGKDNPQAIRLYTGTGGIRGDDNALIFSWDL